MTNSNAENKRKNISINQLNMNAEQIDNANNQKINQKNASKKRTHISSNLLIIVTLLIVTLACFSADTLSKYVASLYKTTGTEVAKWNISCNGIEMGVEPILVNPVLRLTDSENVLEGKIAPGQTGTFELEFDPTGTEVRVEYNLNIDLTQLISGEISNFYLDNVTYRIGENGEDIPINVVNGEVSIIQPLDSILSGDKCYVDINVVWTAEGDHAEDIAIQIAQGSFELPIIARAFQSIDDVIPSSGDTINEMRLVFNSNGGTFKNNATENNVRCQIITSSGDTNIDIFQGKYLRPTKTGIGFIGWTLNSANTGTIYYTLDDIAEVAYNGITLYAKYENVNAQYVGGNKFNQKLKRLANNDNTLNVDSEDTNIQYIRWSSTPPSNIEEMQADFAECKLNNHYSTNFDNNFVGEYFKDYMIYAWYYNHIIYLWSEANYINFANSANKMFSKLKSLKTLDFEEDLHVADTSNTTILSNMFYECESLENINLNIMNTENVSSFGYIFNGCIALTSLDLSEFDTSNATNFSAMFRRCTNLQYVDVSNFDTQNSTTFYDMFNGCRNINNLEIENFDLTNVTTTNSMFCDCSNLSKLDIKDWVTTNKLGNVCSMFENCSSLKELDLTGFNTRNVTYTYDYHFDLFRNCTNIEKITLGTNCTFENVTNFGYSFDGCNKLKQIDLSMIDTTSFEDIRYLFSNCDTLVTLDLSNFYCNNLINMMNVCSSCDNLKIVDFSNLDTRNVTDMSNSFIYDNNLTVIYGGSNFFASGDFVNTTNIFGNCTKLVGSKGTEFISSYDYTYIKVDGGDSAPGLLSEKGGIKAVYYSNYGTGTTYEDTITLGSTYTIASSPFNRTGYILLGYAKTPTSNIIYYPGDTIIIENGIALYARWSATSYTNSSYTFDGTDYIDTEVTLFSRATIDKDFIIEFKKSTDYATQNSENAGDDYVFSILSSMYNDKQGLFLRKTYNDPKENSCSLGIYISGDAFESPINKSSKTYKFIRIDGIIYFAINDSGYSKIADCNSFTDYFENSLIFGGYLNNGSPVRLWKGKLDNMKVQLRDDLSLSNYDIVDDLDELPEIFTLASYEFNGSSDYIIPKIDGTYDTAYNSSNKSDYIYMFSTANQDKDFTITFTMSNCAGNSHQATVLNMKYDGTSPWPGVSMRASNATSRLFETSFRQGNEVSDALIKFTASDGYKITICRKDRKMYIKYTDDNYYEYAYNYINKDLNLDTIYTSFGACINGSTLLPISGRYYKGTLSNISIKMES